MSKYSSKGTVLQREIASVFTNVAQLTKINLGAGEVQFWDGTALDSGVSMEDGELTGHAAPGEAPFAGFYDPVDAVHELFPADIALGGRHVNYKVIMPDTGTSEATFTGSTSKFDVASEVTNGFTFDASIKLRALAVFPSS